MTETPAIDEWQAETLALMEDVRQRRLRAEQRVRAAEADVEREDRALAALRLALDLYCDKYRLPLPSEPVETSLVERYAGAYPRDMVQRWAADHEGRVVMRDFCAAMVRLGLFSDMRRASGTLYSTIKRMSGFRWVSRGLYVNGAVE